MATAKKEKAPKYPKAIGACIDQLYQMRAKRLEAQRAVDEMKAAETQLEDHILNTFTKSELKGAKGDIATASVKVDTTVSIIDWDAFVAYVAKNKAWDLLRKQTASTAVKERWNNKITIPGIEPFGKVSLSLTKAGS